VIATFSRDFEEFDGYGFIKLFFLLLISKFYMYYLYDFYNKYIHAYIHTYIHTYISGSAPQIPTYLRSTVRILL